MSNFETKFTVNVNDIETAFFYCTSSKTRNGFKHDCLVIVPGVGDTSNAKHYLNRTWECYTYQTAINAAFCKLFDLTVWERVERYKAINGLSRISPKAKKAIVAAVKNDMNYYAVRDVIEHGNRKYTGGDVRRENYILSI